MFCRLCLLTPHLSTIPTDGVTTPHFFFGFLVFFGASLRLPLFVVSMLAWLDSSFIHTVSQCVAVWLAKEHAVAPVPVVYHNWSHQQHIQNTNTKNDFGLCTHTCGASFRFYASVSRRVFAWLNDLDLVGNMLRACVRVACACVRACACVCVCSTHFSTQC